MWLQVWYLWLLQGILLDDTILIKKQKQYINIDIIWFCKCEGWELSLPNFNHFQFCTLSLVQLSWTPSEVTGEDREPLLHAELAAGEHELVGQSSFVACVNNLCRSMGELQAGCAKPGSDHTADTPRVLCSGLSAPLGGPWGRE